MVWLRCAGIAAVAAAAIGTLFAAHPNRRVCHLFEIHTDGWAPDYMANGAQLLLYKMWERSFAKGVFDPKGEIASAVAELASNGTVLEIAAGDGGISTMLLKVIRERYGLNTSVVLTDIQPNVAKWKTEQKKHPKGMVDFVAASVDATDIAHSLAKANAGVSAKSARVRMITFALHHFKPELVERIFADVVADRSAIVVGDLKPSAGSVFNNHLVVHPILPEVVREIWPPPLHLLPLLPMLPIVPVLGFWDATISVLRAYSVDELAAIAAKVPGGGPDTYAWKVHETGSFADFLGVPSWLRPLLPGIDTAVGQFFVLYPK